MRLAIDSPTTVAETARELVASATTTDPDQHLEQLCVNVIRGLAMDAVQKANSGHPGMPLGIADAACVLWDRFLKHHPADPNWPNRDRFVLSAGHASMLLYSLLHLTGYDLSLDDIKQFRQLQSRTPGHPEYGLTPGVETTTGPLGQGISNAVGMAMAEQVLAARFNQPGYPVVDHMTYAIVSDGDLMEGISYEVASLAGHLQLGKLIVLYDSNHISIDGSTDLTFTENIEQRFAACGWHVIKVNGHNRQEVAWAIEQARQVNNRPSMIVCDTIIGYGSPNRQGTAKSHGEPLGGDEVLLTKEALGLPTDKPFFVPDEVYTHMRRAHAERAGQQQSWESMMLRYREVYPDLAELWDTMQSGQLPDDWSAVLPTWDTDAKAIATRAASGTAINALAKVLPGLLGGSADMNQSNQTLVKGEEAIQAERFDGRNLYYGVREHAMGGIMNGIALHGGLLPYGGTFLVFSDYMRPAIRMAALMSLQVVYVFTHDSIGVGEDGPTHQPIEHVPALRVIPNLFVMRPADATETVQAWRVALERRNGPTALILTRQGLPVLNRNGTAYGRFGPLASAEGVLRGGYVLYSAPEPQAVLIATGSEVALALQAALLLEADGMAVRVVSMPCCELFDQQDQDYRDAVLLPSVTARVAVEAAASFGWQRYVGSQGRIVGIDTFGVSAPGAEVFRYYGLTAERVAATVKDVVHAGG
ncbi:MAG: transketolase [Chloroflexaceae bacterium]|nr:transketolase [Chloroflexaceae bacterium]